MLCGVEALVIVLAVWLEKKKEIFVTQAMFCLTLVYHFLFILLNLVLYEEEQLKEVVDAEEIVDLFLYFQKCVVYGLIFFSSVEFVLDFIPNNLCNGNE